MKTLSKVFMSSFLTCAAMRIYAKINPLFSFIFCMFAYGAFMVAKAFQGALKVKNASQGVIKDYNKRVDSFRLKK